MKKLLLRFLPVADVLLLPFIYPSAWLLKGVRRAGVQRLPNCKNALMKIGVFPIRDHYYEPQFDHRKPKHPFSQDRNLPGIDWNAGEQLKMLATFSFSKELANTPQEKPDTLDFYLNNDSFRSGDAEYWYQLIRSIKPKRVFEIGSGYSTLLSIKATRKNREQDPDYNCKHVCIEPYEMPWLEETGVSVVRRKVEDVALTFFSELQENDILFVDSSHIIRPQGDVLFEYLELLPTLNKGVIVHVHDIFSPKNYPKQWLENEVRFWNEQYLLEAFLSHNGSWKIIGALNYLRHNYYEALKSVAPFLTPDREPGSFYIQKTVAREPALARHSTSVNGVDAAVYGDHYYRDLDGGSESMSSPGLAAIQRLAQHSHNILDCGCGEGSKLSHVGAPDAMRTGVEWSEEGVRRAAQRPGLKVVRADIRRMPFPDGTFDFVFSAYVLEHTTEPAAVVSEMIRVLAPGGYLALLCPNYGSPFFCSPCSRANPWWRAIRLALRDIFIGWRSRRTLIWEPVAPIATADHWSSDWDTTVEPALIPLLHHLRAQTWLRVVQADSFWRPPPAVAPDASRAKRLKHSIKSAVANSPLRRMPWLRYWGLDLFVVLEKALPSKRQFAMLSSGRPI